MLTWSWAIEQSPLFQRGWVLQEYMLASRTLFWTEVGLFWRCNKLEESENDITNEFNVFNTTAPRKLRDIVRCMVNTDDNLLQSRRSTWPEIIEDFSKKTLTVATDRIPAVTGLGKEIARLIGRVYHMGVFEHNLVQELAWVIDYQDRRSDVAGTVVEPCAIRLPNIPSWSWASTDQEVNFWRGYEPENLATCVSFHEQNQIKFQGRLGTIRVKRLNDRVQSGITFFRPGPHTFEPVRPQDEWTELFLRQFVVFDTLADVPPEGDAIVCVEWMSWLELRRVPERVSKTGALVLAPVDEENSIFRRIGWLEMVNPDFFEDEQRQVFLV